MEGASASGASIVVVSTWLIVRVSVEPLVSVIVEVNVSWIVIMWGWASDLMRYPAMSPNMRSVIASPAILTDLAIAQPPRTTP